MRVRRVKNATDVLAKIENIEKEVMNLKLIVLKKLTLAGKKKISFKGILKGVNITDADVARAKKSLYSKIGA